MWSIFQKSPPEPLRATTFSNPRSAFRNPIKDQFPFKSIPGTPDGVNNLVLAIKDNNIESVIELITENPDYVNYVLNTNLKPLHYAAAVGNVEIVRVLIEAGAELEASDKYGETALNIASAFGHADVVRQLLTAGAKVDARSNKGFTPLMGACSKTYSEVVQGGYLDTVRVLIEAGADVNARGKGFYYKDSTPLFIAAIRGHIDITELLLTSGVDWTMRNQDGKTIYAQLLTYINDQLHISDPSRVDNAKMEKYRNVIDMMKSHGVTYGGRRKTRKSRKSKRKTRRN
jgi:ankyrin repeat protein